MGHRTGSIDPYEEFLDSFGYELIDLGVDFDSIKHLYYVDSKKTGEPLSDHLLYREEIKQIIKTLSRKT